MEQSKIKSAIFTSGEGVEITVPYEHLRIHTEIVHDQVEVWLDVTLNGHVESIRIG